MIGSVVKVGGVSVGESHSVFFVAEIGINHNGNVSIAKKLIDVAAAAGCGAVKFQKRTIEVVYTPEELAKPRESPFGPTNGDLKRGLEFGQAEYEEIDRHCKRVGIMWFATCFDERSVDFIDRFDPPAYKVASFFLTDDDLLRHTRGKGKPVILSTGMSTVEQIDLAVEILGRRDLVMLHCVSTYPNAPDELNLRVMDTLRCRYGVPVGYSGHEMGWLPSLLAVAMGACVIERHITLDRAMWGTDHKISLDPEDLRKLVEGIALLEKVRGDGVKRLLESEVPIMRKYRRK